MGPKKFYRFHTKSFRQLKLQTDIYKFTDAYSPENTIFTVYLGVVVENEDNSEFDDSEWDEVFNIVDSYANDYEQGGVESQNEGEGEEESDRLYESEYEMNVDDDTEQGDQTEHGGLDNVEESGDDSHEGEASDPEEAATESDVEETDDDFDSVAGSDEEDKVPKCVFNPRNKYNPHFEIGMIFSNKVELRDAIHSHAVSTKRSLKIMKNDKRRVYVKCLGDGCQWRLNALKLGDPKRNVKGFRKDVIKEIRCHVSKNQAYRAKKKALNAIEGKAEDQFECLWDYAAELRSSNPGPYGGVLLTAVAIDPNNNLYPLAYAVVAGKQGNHGSGFLNC
ncbi:UNVERIFIED_CONTAM: hypothetical protein Sradi_3627600 [Sesamum radiatum]|uniref:Transposase MuDR plant domain-containing protein n=1 Tax=Sesamum radiatum TaxID=300843 RepID=A0AAW2QIH2_SESRA